MRGGGGVLACLLACYQYIFEETGEGEVEEREGRCWLES